MGRKNEVLSKRNLAIFAAYNVKLLSLGDLAEEFGLTRQRVSQIVKDVSERLGVSTLSLEEREAKRDKLGEAVKVGGVTLLDFMQVYLKRNTIEEMARIMPDIGLKNLLHVARVNGVEFVSGDHVHCPDCGTVLHGTTTRRCSNCTMEYRKRYRKEYARRPEVRAKAKAKYERDRALLRAIKTAGLTITA